MTALVVIPARGGSKGIPRKNLLPVGGRPLITWTITQALAARRALEDVLVVVSTEDTEIASVSRAAGARVIDRPAHLAEDTTPTEPVILHAMDVVEAEGEVLDAVVLLQATSPVRREDTVRRAIESFRSGPADALIGVVPESPFFWRLPERPGVGAVPAYDPMARPRRQDLEPEQMHYFENGSLYVTAPQIYREQENRIGGLVELFVLDEAEGTDIDTVADVAAAESMLTHLGWRLP
ncbi:MAG: acylneuraminate cytidylyltransferase family protein [Brachybacterium sp.]|nr:acylneuraminate cytidylyltransferase family protein [Brachybacterium sp.]